VPIHFGVFCIIWTNCVAISWTVTLNSKKIARLNLNAHSTYIESIRVNDKCDLNPEPNPFRLGVCYTYSHNIWRKEQTNTERKLLLPDCMECKVIVEKNDCMTLSVGWLSTHRYQSGGALVIWTASNLSVMILSATRYTITLRNSCFNTLFASSIKQKHSKYFHQTDCCVLRFY